jgi:tetratricopeptide (TPR) repeat protein
MVDSVLETILNIENLILEEEYKKAQELLESISSKNDLLEEDKLACTLLESNIILNLGEREKAFKSIERLWQKIQKTENPLLILDYLNIQINTLWGKGNYEDGMRIFDENIEFVSDLETKTPKEIEKRFKRRKYSFLRNGGILHWYRGNLDTALKYHEQSLAIGEEIESELSIVSSCNNIGLVYWSKGDLDKAIEYYQKALSISEKLGRDKAVAQIMSNLGSAFTTKGNLDKALEYQQHSLDLRRKISNKHEIAMSLINIGVVYQFKGDIDRSLECYKEGLLLSEQIDSKANIALALNNIGNIHDLRGNPDLALEFFERSLNLYKELGVKEKVALLLSNLGYNCKIKGNINKALDYYNQSLISFEEIGNPLGISFVYLELILIALERNEHDIVQEYLAKFQQINKSANMPSVYQRFRLAQALSLRTSNKSRDKIKAIIILEQIVEEEIVDYSLTVKAMVNLCDFLIQDLKEKAEMDLLTEIKDLLQKLKIIAEEQSSDSILAEVYRMEALLALAELDLKETKILLEKGYSIAKEKGLVRIESDIREEQNRLIEKIDLWESLQERKAPLKETLKHVKIEESMKQLQHEENIASGKLFSLKI